MKYITLIVLLCSTAVAFAQGSTCATAINISMDGVVYNYQASPTTGNSVICTNYTSSTPITWFKFTTNASAHCPLLNIAVSDSLPVEIAMYTACSGGQILQSASSMCFDDGRGLWAPSETFVPGANTTYFLRIKTTTSANISIGGQHYIPGNNTCAGALSITTSPLQDNNACHTGGPGVIPSQLCAFTLENTAFYKFIVAAQGSAIINISNISCDNGAANNSTGFQIGFFSGSCNNLIALSCTNGSGDYVQATTPPLPAGSLVFVAIDGISGANCSYSLTGVNVYSVLSTNFKNLSGWEHGKANRLAWTTRFDSSAYYIIERSEDGESFTSIGQIVKPLHSGHELHYQFEDYHPTKRSFYRVKQISMQGAVAVSPSIKVERKNTNAFHINVRKALKNHFEVDIIAPKNNKVHASIISSSGIVISESFLNVIKGNNIVVFTKSPGYSGHYFICLRTSDGEKLVKKVTIH